MYELWGKFNFQNKDKLSKTQTIVKMLNKLIQTTYEFNSIFALHFVLWMNKRWDNSEVCRNVWTRNNHANVHRIPNIDIFHDTFFEWVNNIINCNIQLLSWMHLYEPEQHSTSPSVTLLYYKKKIRIILL